MGERGDFGSSRTRYSASCHSGRAEKLTQILERGLTHLHRVASLTTEPISWIQGTFCCAGICFYSTIRDYPTYDQEHGDESSTIPCTLH